MGSYEKIAQRDDVKKALSRVEMLVDSGSLSQIEAFSADSNVLAGFATINLRPCYIYCQYGNVNFAHAKKISALYKQAITMGAPVIGILDSKGMELSEGLDSLSSYGQIFQTMSEASGVIPQFALVLGQCMGSGSIIAGLSDYVFALNDSKLFVQSPSTVPEVMSIGENYIFTGKYHFEKTGLVQFAYDSQEKCLEGFKNFFDFIPSNNLEDAPINVAGQTDLNMDYLNSLNGNSADADKLLTCIADNGEFVEAGKGHGDNVRTYFARFDGAVAAVAVNNGVLKACGIKKLTKFVGFCDSFNIPIVNLTDVSAFGEGINTQKDMIKNLAALVYACSNATVGKVNIIIKNAVGSPYLVSNSKFIGADLVYTWPNTNITLFEKEAAQKVLGCDYSGADYALENGYIDNVIEPSDTRKTIITAIETLSTKRVFKHPKKHGNVCL